MSLNISDLGGGGNAWPSTEAEIGETITGRIVSIDRKQQTDIKTGEPLYWSNGDPRMQTLIGLQTDLRESDDDDGLRTLWLKGGKNFQAAQGSGLSGEQALIEAVRKAGVKSVDEGGTLTFRLTGLSKPTQRGYNPAKLYKAKYEPPKASIELDDLFDGAEDISEDADDFA